MALLNKRSFRQKLAQELQEHYGGINDTSAIDWTAVVEAVQPALAPFLDIAERRMADFAALDPRIREAFSKPNQDDLVLGLAKALAWYAHCFYEATQDRHQRPPTKAEWDSLKQPNTTLAASAMFTVTRFFLHNMYLMYQRLTSDWDDLNRLFWPHDTLVKLRRVILTGSDFHKEGKSVMILEFELWPTANRAFQFNRKGKAVVARLGHGLGRAAANTLNTPRFERVVYKPSDVELDCRITGDTHTLTARLAHRVYQAVGGPPLSESLPDLTGGSFFELLNEQAAPPIPLPTYLIWPRFPGSLLTEDAHGTLAIQESYGWVQFLEHNPKADDSSGNSSNIDQFNQAQWDWIGTSAAEIQDFYVLFGWYCACGVALAFCDSHEGNVMVHNRKPYLIDLEICFKSKIRDLTATMLSRSLDAAKGPPEFKNQFFYRDGTGTMYHTRGRNAALTIGTAVDAALSSMAASMAALRTWAQTPQMAKTIARYTPRATMVFASRLREIYRNHALDPPLDPALATDTDWDRIFSHSKRLEINNYFGNERRPNFVLQSKEHDYWDYLNCDIPCYYRRLSEWDLRNARGRKVVVTQPPRGSDGALGLPDANTTRVGDTGNFRLTVGANVHPFRLADAQNHLTGLAQAINLLGAGVTAAPVVLRGRHNIHMDVNAGPATTLRLECERADHSWANLLSGNFRLIDGPRYFDFEEQISPGPGAPMRPMNAIDILLWQLNEIATPASRASLLEQIQDDLKGALGATTTKAETPTYADDTTAPVATGLQMQLVIGAATYNLALGGPGNPPNTLDGLEAALRAANPPAVISKHSHKIEIRLKKPGPIALRLLQTPGNPATDILVNRVAGTDVPPAPADARAV